MGTTLLSLILVFLKTGQGGYVEGSKALPDTQTTAETLANLLPSMTTPILFYCNGPQCGRSAVAAVIAAKAGYTRIYWYAGGWEDWLANEMPVVMD